MNIAEASKSIAVWIFTKLATMIRMIVNLSAKVFSYFVLMLQSVRQDGFNYEVSFALGVSGFESACIESVGMILC